MPSTKMFRDRVVSMEQTFEKGEKHLALLQGLIAEALPDLEFREYLLDHEHDTFVMVYGAPAGGEKRIRWTRMVLYDAERIPAIIEDAQAPIRARLVDFLRRRGERAVIDVTFRHLEDGWVDTPEPRKPKPRSGPPARPGGPAAPGRRGGQTPPPPRPSPPGRPAGPGAPGPAPAAQPGGAPAGKRRRFRRRRGRRRGPAGPPTA
jgi:hypothetical protein